MQFQGYIFLHFDFLMLCGSVKYLNFPPQKKKKKRKKKSEKTRQKYEKEKTKKKKLKRTFEKKKSRKNRKKIGKKWDFCLWLLYTVFCAFVTFEIKVYDHSFRKGRWKDLRMHFLTQIYVETTSLKTRLKYLINVHVFYQIKIGHVEHSNWYQKVP